MTCAAITSEVTTVNAYITCITIIVYHYYSRFLLSKQQIVIDNTQAIVCMSYKTS